MREYYEWGGSFSDVYLEDSFVTKITESETDLIFDMEFVLTEKHPLFHKPKKDEQYCYRKGRLVFSGISSLDWKRRVTSCFHDANAEVDYGNIDVLTKTDGNKYKVSGDWGEVDISSSCLEIILD